MCFSATASFTAAAGLGALGVVTTAKVRDKKELHFALMPLLFGVQQAAEGLVWVGIASGNAILNELASHVFVYFAFAFWPLFIPLMVLLMEKTLWRRRLLYLLAFSGTALGVYFMYILAQYPVRGYVLHSCIAYATPHFDEMYFIGLYVLATCLSLMLSSNLTIKYFGIVASVSLIVTYAFYQFALVSVWCFFSAVLSVITARYFFRKKR